MARILCCGIVMISVASFYFYLLFVSIPPPLYHTFPGLPEHDGRRGGHPAVRQRWRGGGGSAGWLPGRRSGSGAWFLERMSVSII